ncbi:hypothetical protein FACS189426_11870 [Bacteroidia bacterium]|nr:hypothetical protein FACS189426_11870 [Bacteroidia bacterium]GHV70345.1 hypothetical protein FACS189420_1060 [Bacteroidia bacterium]
MKCIEDEIPFEIPENWMWVKGSECFKPMESKKPTGDTFGYIDINSIDNKKHKITEPKYLSVTDAPSRANRGVEIGATLFSMVRPYLENIAYVDAKYSNCIASTGFFVCQPTKVLYPKYLYYLMLSSYVIDGLNAFMKGDNSPSINNENITSYIFPIPPFPEQQRIVSVIESAFTWIDEIENDKTSLEQIIKQAKAKVLDLAIHGKLVPQNPNDEPASVLLERIKAEQKTKKQTADISHYPFEIPEDWVWCKMENIGNWSAGTTPSRTNSNYYVNGTIPWLKTGDLNDDIITSVSEYISESALIECKQLKLNPIGSVVIALYGATIGRCGILNIETTTNQACCVCKPNSIIFNKYLFYYLLSHREDFKDKAEGGAQPNISKDKIINTQIPIPPLKEQHRIVSQIETIFKTLDSIQNNL